MRTRLACYAGGMIRASRVVGPVVGLLMAAACNATRYDDDVPVDQAEAVCAYMVRCGLFVGSELCVDYFTAAFTPDADLAAALDDGSVRYDGKAARACFDTIRESECAANYFGRGPDDPNCEMIFEGTIADGDPCWIDEQCVSGRCNDPGSCDAACCMGWCSDTSTEVLPALGEACKAGEECSGGAYCDYEGTWTCLARQASGAACELDRECEVGLACLAGACHPGVAEGEPCIDNRCGDVPYYCNIESGICSAFGQAGAGCSTLSSTCALGFTCAVDTCAPVGGLGTACSGGPFDLGCALGFWCDDELGSDGAGTCQAVKENGAACLRDEECVSRHCGEADTCEAEVACVE